MTDLSKLDMIGHAELIRRREATALELIDAAIARIEGTRDLNAVICDLFDHARGRAIQPLGDGPLAGAPFLLKDLGASLQGTPERMGSVALRGYVADRSSVLVERYEQAGLLIAGKTNTPEWGNHCTTEPVLFGPTINPRAPELSPGGSSGGSAVAVAVGLVPAASGGDATGSIRVPASACGVIGLKPTRGRNSCGPGAGQIVEGLGCAHALTRSVRDCAALLDATAGWVPGDPYTAPPPNEPWLTAIGRDPAPLRIRWTVDGPFGGLTHPETRSGVEAAVGLLADLGHRVDQGSPAFDPEPVIEAVAVLHEVSNLELYALAQSVLGRPPHRDELEPTAWEMLEEGRARAAASATPAQSRPSTPRAAGSPRASRMRMCSRCRRSSPAARRRSGISISRAGALGRSSRSSSRRPVGLRWQTCPDSRRSRCRLRRPATGCRSGCSSWPRRRPFCSSSPPSSSASVCSGSDPARMLWRTVGGTGARAHRCSGELGRPARLGRREEPRAELPPALVRRLDPLGDLRAQRIEINRDGNAARRGPVLLRPVEHRRSRHLRVPLQAPRTRADSEALERHLAACKRYRPRRQAEP